MILTGKAKYVQAKVEYAGNICKLFFATDVSNLLYDKMATWPNKNWVELARMLFTEGIL